MLICLSDMQKDIKFGSEKLCIDFSAVTALDVANMDKVIGILNKVSAKVQYDISILYGFIDRKTRLDLLSRGISISPLHYEGKACLFYLCKHKKESDYRSVVNWLNQSNQCTAKLQYDNEAKPVIFIQI